MTKRMSMRERHQKVEELVMQDPRVLDCSHRFCDAQREINEWHVRNNPPSCATMGQLKELEELLAYSEWCLEDLKCAKRCAYNQLMSQYPRVWDTSCDDPFDTGTQDDATEAGAETEEMEEVPTPTPLIRADKLMDILNREKDAVEVTIESCELWDLDASDVLARLATIQTIRTQLEKLINQAKEATNA